MHAKPEESLKTERANKPAGWHKWKVQERMREEAYVRSARKKEKEKKRRSICRAAISWQNFHSM